ncbi:hypothetical protein NDA16_004599 [Ustilago loliicola]|nr:hypothetical protein NDA16_004599 [Ustilago loliicola]
MPVEAPSNAPSAMTLSASVSNVTGLANLLKSVAIQTHAVVIASSSGLEIVTELNRTLQAHAYLYSHMFDAYTFNKPSSSIQNGTSSRPSRPHGSGPSHSHVRNDTAGAGSGSSSGGRGYGRTRDGTVDPYGGGDRGGSVERGFDRNNLSSAAKATRMKLSYQGHGHPLVLELEQEANVLTRCSISTYEPSFLTDMVFDPRNMVAQVIVGSELMQSAFSEIDASCKKLSILITSPHSSLHDDDADLNDSVRSTRGYSRANSASMLRFKAISDTGSSEMEFPASLSSADPTGVIEKFVALPGSSEQWYDFTLLSRTMTVLRSSIKTSLRMDEAGLISFQFMMPKYRRTAVPAAAGAASGPAADQAALEDEQDAFCEFLVGI